MFARVLDVELLSNYKEKKDPLWSLQTLQLQNECMKTDNEIQIIDVGQSHTLSLSDGNKIYSYGWNDCYQLGRLASQDNAHSSFGQIHVVPTFNEQPRLKSVISL